MCRGRCNPTRAACKGEIAGGYVIAGAKGELKLTLEIQDIAFGDGTNGVDIVLKAYGRLSMSIAGYSFALPGLNLRQVISNVVDLDAITNGH